MVKPHHSFCCVLHGCKHGNLNCPVVKGRLPQLRLCEQCQEEGLTKILHPKDPDYDVWQMSFFELRQEVLRLRKQLGEKS